MTQFFLNTLLPLTAGTSALLAIAQFFGKVSRIRTLTAILLIDLAYLNYHLYLLATQNIINKAYHFLGFIPALLLLGPLLLHTFYYVQHNKIKMPHALLMYTPFLASILFLALIHQYILDKKHLIQDLYAMSHFSLYSLAGVSTILIFFLFLVQLYREIKKTQVPIKLGFLQSIFVSALLFIFIFSNALGSVLLLEFGAVLLVISYCFFLLYYLRHPNIFDNIFKKKKSQLAHLNIDKKVAELKTLFEKENIHQDCEISLNDVAKKIKLNLINYLN